MKGIWDFSVLSLQFPMNLKLFQDEKSPYYELLNYKNPCYGNNEGSACKNIKGLM